MRERYEYMRAIMTEIVNHATMSQSSDPTSDQGLHCLPPFQQFLDISTGSEIELFNVWVDCLQSSLSIHTPKFP